MDGVSFERVYDNFQDFHAFFAASFGRKQWREHSRNYLQGLLVQAGERRNAENLSESVGISARAMQRFLTEARWSDDAVIGRLQEYLAPRLVPFPLEYALYRIFVSPVSHCRASRNPELEAAFQYQQI